MINMPIARLSQPLFGQKAKSTATNGSTEEPSNGKTTLSADEQRDANAAMLAELQAKNTEREKLINELSQS
ncbi:MAG: hypothetical protein VKJ06_05520 [Vampirovibrionales bacterium]|nr:hypothetical protein [Vampirovibrionales bacterium]